MKKMSRSTGAVALLCVVVLVAACIYFFEMRQGSPSNASSTAFQQHTVGALTLDGKTINIFVANNDAERALGLGGMTGLAPNQGMLFIFPADGEYAFWMKDMSFSIDMVWIADNGKIVFIAPNVAPSTYPGSFQPNSPARYVLELPANYAKNNGVKVGDIVHFQ